MKLLLLLLFLAGVSSQWLSRPNPNPRIRNMRRPPPPPPRPRGPPLILTPYPPRPYPNVTASAIATEATAQPSPTTVTVNQNVTNNNPSPSNPPLPDYNSVFSERMIELLKKLGDVTENTTNPEITKEIASSDAPKPPVPPTTTVASPPPDSAINPSQEPVHPSLRNNGPPPIPFPSRPIERMSPARPTLWGNLQSMFSRKKPLPPSPARIQAPTAMKSLLKPRPTPTSIPIRRFDENIEEEQTTKAKSMEESPPDVRSPLFANSRSLLDEDDDQPPKLEERSYSPPTKENTLSVLAKLSPKKPIVLFMRQEGIMETQWAGADPGKVVKKYAGSTKIQFFNGTVPEDNVPPVFLAPEDTIPPRGYGKMPIPKLDNKSELPAPKPTYLPIEEQIKLLMLQREKLKLMQYRKYMDSVAGDSKLSSSYNVNTHTDAFKVLQVDGGKHSPDFYDKVKNSLPQGAIVESIMPYNPYERGVLNKSPVSTIPGHNGNTNAYRKPSDPTLPAPVRFQHPGRQPQPPFRTETLQRPVPPQNQVPPVNVDKPVTSLSSQGIEIELPPGSNDGLISDLELQKILGTLIGGDATVATKDISGRPPPGPFKGNNPQFGGPVNVKENNPHFGGPINVKENNPHFGGPVNVKENNPHFRGPVNSNQNNPHFRGPVNSNQNNPHFGGPVNSNQNNPHFGGPANFNQNNPHVGGPGSLHGTKANAVPNGPPKSAIGSDVHVPAPEEDDKFRFGLNFFLGGKGKKPQAGGLQKFLQGKKTLFGQKGIFGVFGQSDVKQGVMEGQPGSKSGPSNVKPGQPYGPPGGQSGNNFESPHGQPGQPNGQGGTHYGSPSGHHGPSNGQNYGHPGNLNGHPASPNGQLHGNPQQPQGPPGHPHGNHQQPNGNRGHPQQHNDQQNGHFGPHGQHNAQQNGPISGQPGPPYARPNGQPGPPDAQLNGRPGPPYAPEGGHFASPNSPPGQHHHGRPGQTDGPIHQHSHEPTRHFNNDHSQHSENHDHQDHYHRDEHDSQGDFPTERPTKTSVNIFSYESEEHRAPPNSIEKAKSVSSSSNEYLHETSSSRHKKPSKYNKSKYSKEYYSKEENSAEYKSDVHKKGTTIIINSNKAKGKSSSKPTVIITSNEGDMSNVGKIIESLGMNRDDEEKHYSHHQSATMALPTNQEAVPKQHIVVTHVQQPATPPTATMEFSFDQVAQLFQTQQEQQQPQQIFIQQAPQPQIMIQHAQPQQQSFLIQSAQQQPQQFLIQQAPQQNQQQYIIQQAQPQPQQYIIQQAPQHQQQQQYVIQQAAAPPQQQHHMLKAQPAPPPPQPQMPSPIVVPNASPDSNLPRVIFVPNPPTAPPNENPPPHIYTSVSPQPVTEPTAYRNAQPPAPSAVELAIQKQHAEAVAKIRSEHAQARQQQEFHAPEMVSIVGHRLTHNAHPMHQGALAHAHPSPPPQQYVSTTQHYLMSSTGAVQSTQHPMYHAHAQTTPSPLHYPSSTPATVHYQHTSPHTMVHYEVAHPTAASHLAHAQSPTATPSPLHYQHGPTGTPQPSVQYEHAHMVDAQGMHYTVTPSPFQYSQTPTATPQPVHYAHAPTGQPLHYAPHASTAVPQQLHYAHAPTAAPQQLQYAHPPTPGPQQLHYPHAPTPAPPQELQYAHAPTPPPQELHYAHAPTPPPQMVHYQHAHAPPGAPQQLHYTHAHPPGSIPYPPQTQGVLEEEASQSIERMDAPQVSMSVQSFSTMKPSHNEEERYLEKVRTEEKIIWRELAGTGAEPARLVPIKITTQERSFINPDGRAEVESTVLNTEIAHELVGHQPMDVPTFMKRNGHAVETPDSDGYYNNANANTKEDLKPLSFRDATGNNSKRPDSAFADLLKTQAEMVKMEHELHPKRVSFGQEPDFTSFFG